jgi:hypothetical protein
MSLRTIMSPRHYDPHGGPATDLAPRCPSCRNALSYVHEYPAEIVPNGRPVVGLTASYVYRCPNDGLWRVFAGGTALPYTMPTFAATVVDRRGVVTAP